MTAITNKMLIQRLYQEVFAKWNLEVVDELIDPRFILLFVLAIPSPIRRQKRSVEQDESCLKWLLAGELQLSNYCLVFADKQVQNGKEACETEAQFVFKPFHNGSPGRIMASV